MHAQRGWKTRPSLERGFSAHGAYDLVFVPWHQALGARVLGARHRSTGTGHQVTRHQAPQELAVLLEVANLSLLASCGEQAKRSKLRDREAVATFGTVATDSGQVPVARSEKHVALLSRSLFERVGP